jgi:phosphatidylinositol alpha-1,6-mannosyltransferase
VSGVLFVTRNFPPLVGGMERLALEAVRALAEAADVTLVGPKGCEAWHAGETRGVAHASAARFLLDSWWTARHLAAANHYQWVIGGSGLAAPAVLAAARRAGARSACLVHGLDLVVDSAVYRTLCLPALRRMDRLIANSHNTARLAGQVGIPAERVRVLHPGVALADGAEAEPFLEAFPVARNRRVLLSVGRLLPRKGLVDFVRHVLPAVVARHPDVLLVIAGGRAADALARQGDEERRLREAVSQTGLASHVLFTGEVSDALLQALYGAASLLVFPVQDLPGDVEGFGMVALEAAAQGVPTIAFAAGGVPDAVADGVSGFLLPAGEFDRMAARVNACLDGDWAGVSAHSCRAFAEGFAWPRYGERLRELLFGG